MSKTSTPREPPVAGGAPAEVAGPDEVFAGMACVDTSGSRRLPILMEMVAALSRADDPNSVLREFASGFYRLYGPQGYVSLSTRGLGPGEYKVTRLVPDMSPGRIDAVDPWLTWSSIPVSRGGFFGQIIRKAYPEIIHHLDVRDDPVVGDALANFGSLMAIPLFDAGEPLNWSITLREDPEAFSVAELEEAILRANLGGATVKNVMITKQLRETHAALRREVEQIAKIQRALLPRSIPEVPGLEIGVSYETFDQAGGDMYALHPLRRNGKAWDPGGPWGVLVADVSGHGPAAAVVMAMMQSILDAYPGEPTGPAEVLDHLNRHLCAKRIESRFATAFFAIYDPVSRRFNYSRAGHNPPVWMQPDPDAGGWRMSRLDANGAIPLGINEEARYEETAVTLEPGQTIVLYTDGITEARSLRGEMFGIGGIEGSLTECTGYPQCAISHITSSLQEFQGSVRPSDDQTLVVMRVT